MCKWLCWNTLRSDDWPATARYVAHRLVAPLRQPHPTNHHKPLESTDTGGHGARRDGVRGAAMQPKDVMTIGVPSDCRRS